MKAYSTHTLLQWCSVYLSGVLFQMKVHKFYSFFHSLEKKNNSSVNDQKDGMKWNPIIIFFLNEFRGKSEQSSITWSFNWFDGSEFWIQWEYFPTF